MTDKELLEILKKVHKEGYWDNESHNLILEIVEELVNRSVAK